jgi:TPR repeat protein
MEGAAELDQAHVTSRNGHTPRDLRERGLVLFEQQCAANDADACFEHGKLLVRRGDSHASVQIDKGCALGSGEACLYLGNHAHGDRKRAAAMFEQACARDSARGCELLAFYVDKQRAIELHRKACAGDDGVACARSGVQRRAAGDRAGAFDDFVKACDISELASCDDAGVLAPDPARARELFRRACDAEIGSGCGHLGDLVARGEGGERDWGKGIELAEQGCKLDHLARCAHATQLRAHPPDWHCTSEDECSRFCDEGIARSCRQLGELMTAGKAGAYERGCRAGDATSCLIAGNAVFSIEEASDDYERGCKLGDRTACTYAQYARALAGSAAASEALRTMCPASTEACVLYGLAIEKREPARAGKLWRDACARKHGPACRLIAFQLHSPYGSGTCDCDMHTPTKAELAEEARLKKLYDESQRFLKLGCDLGDARSCSEADGERDVAPARAATTPAWE